MFESPLVLNKKSISVEFLNIAMKCVYSNNVQYIAKTSKPDWNACFEGNVWVGGDMNLHIAHYVVLYVLM